jgi:hypothetical protein
MSGSSAPPDKPISLRTAGQTNQVTNRRTNQSGYEPPDKPIRLLTAGQTNQVTNRRTNSPTCNIRLQCCAVKRTSKQQILCEGEKPKCIDWVWQQNRQQSVLPAASSVELFCVDYWN